MLMSEDSLGAQKRGRVKHYWSPSVTRVVSEIFASKRPLLRALGAWSDPPGPSEGKRPRTFLQPRARATRLHPDTARISCSLAIVAQHVRLDKHWCRSAGPRLSKMV